VFDSELDLVGNSIDSFMEYALESAKLIYFHNLRFDGNFIIYWLLTHGFRHYEGEKHSPDRGSFSTVISSEGQFYKISVVTLDGIITDFQDSLKKIPLSVAAMAKAYGLEMEKGTMDYKKVRYPGHVPEPEEVRYVRSDVRIVAEVLRHQYEEGLDSMTSSADALKLFKASIGGEDEFRKMFPELTSDEDAAARAAYRGGFTYADTRTAGKIVGEGIVLDVNSLYPYVMHDRPLPCGHPHNADWVPKDDDVLYIATFNFTAKLKPRGIPCIQLRRSFWACPNEYQKVIPEVTEMRLTSVDWKLINDMYDVDLVSIHDVTVFDTCEHVFDKYIGGWMMVKENSIGGKRQIAKLMLNSLYGKFASRVVHDKKVPYLEDDRVKYEFVGDEKGSKPVYTPLGVFITAWARDKTIRAAAANYERFLYADTDSLHLLGTTPPDNLEIHNTHLGAWKVEGTFDRGIFVRAKQYCEESDGLPDTHIAGLPRSWAHKITPDDLLSPQRWYGKLVPKVISGGTYLTETHFTFAPVKEA